MLRHFQKLVWFILLFLFASIGASGQELGDICRELFETAFTELGQNCAGLADNSSCYGYGGVTSSFVDMNANPIPADATMLLEAGQQTALYNIENNQILRSIETTIFSPLLDATIDGIHVVQAGENLFRISLLYGVEVEEIASFNDIANARQIFVGQELKIPGLYDETRDLSNMEALEASHKDWGIAAIYTDANIPQQLDSSGARILVFGETQLADNVPIENIFIPDTIVNVSVNEAEIYTAPPGYYVVNEVIRTISGEFEADAISPDAEWVRVFYLYDRTYGSRATAWLATSSLEGEPDLSALPVLSANHGTPMQHMQLDMTINQRQCDGDKTGGILIQSDDAIETDLSINRYPVRLSSALFAELVAPECLRILALDGIIQVFPEAENPIILVPGYDIILGYDCLPEGENGDGNSGDGNEEAELFIGEPTLVDNFELNTISGLTASAPDNLFNAIQTVTILTASGNGGPVNVIALRDPAEIERILALCAAGLLPDDVCIRF